MTETDPEKRLIGYACISTYGQMLDTQLSRAYPRRRRRSGIGRLTDPTAAAQLWLRAGSSCPEAVVVPRLRRDSDGGSGVLLGLPASEHLVRLRLRWIHDLLVNAGIGGQLDDVAVRVAEIDRAAEAVVDRAAHLNRTGAALLQYACEDIVVDAERDVEVERVLSLEVERLARHLEECEAGTIVHLEEGVQCAPLIDREGADQFEA